MESLRAKFEAVLPHLDERQQRLVMAGEARSLGHGGIAAVARATRGVAVADLAGGGRAGGRGGAAGRVRRGRRGPQDGDRDRSGAGRRAAGAGGADSARGSGIGVVLDDAVDPQAGGRTDRGRAPGRRRTRWPGCCANRASACRPTRRPLEGGQHPDRDAQFAYLNDQASAHLAAGDPVISVDTKKKELVGPVQERRRGMAPGRAARTRSRSTTSSTPPWARPTPTASTTWPPTPAGSAWAPTTTPPRSPSTPSAAGGTPGRHHATRHASRLLITADGGGSNGYRTRLWKTELAALAAETGPARSPSATSRPAPANGTRSSTDCSPTSR